MVMYQMRKTRFIDPFIVSSCGKTLVNKCCIKHYSCVLSRTTATLFKALDVLEMQVKCSWLTVRMQFGRTG